MKNSHLITFEVTRVHGGIKEFAETGKYPDYLYFYSSYYQRRWKQRCVSDDQTGTIRYKGDVIFEYKLSNTGCLGRAILSGEPVSEWEKIKMGLTLLD